MGTVVANLVGILLAFVLLGVAVWVVGIAALAYLVSREAIAPTALVRAGASMSATVIGYVAIVVLVGILLGR